MALLDSDLGKWAMVNVAKALENPTRRITGLSFKFCFLSSVCIHILSKGIEINKSLIRLDLSSNSLKTSQGL